MSAAGMPVNLTTAALDLGGKADASSAMAVLLRPDISCEQVSGAWLQAQGPADATQHEVYVVIAGQGGIRCHDDSVMDVTAGDVVYVAPGTRRGFEAMSPKLHALRLMFPKSDPATDPG